MPFKQGDVVELNSGGPKMTVQHIVGVTTSREQTFMYHAAHRNDGDLITQWFDKSELKSGMFSPGQVRLSTSE